MTITYLIIGFTALISFMAFNNQELLYKMKHWPYQEARHGEYYRWLTSGFLHADPMHLIFNMLTLYFFGKYVEDWFQVLFPGFGATVYMIFYCVAIVAASSATYFAMPCCYRVMTGSVNKAALPFALGKKSSNRMISSKQPVPAILRKS